MNELKAFCPGCKNEVVFVKTTGVSKCPVCGTAYWRSLTPSREPVEPSPVFGMLGVLFRVFLIIVGLVFVGMAIAFAGCVVAFSGH